MTAPERMPLYFTANEVRLELDKQRRRLRANTIWLVVFQILVAGPVRIAADSLIANPRLAGIAFIQPYVVPAMVVLVIFIWVCGIKAGFRR
jgi:hypothetical protein